MFDEFITKKEDSTTQVKKEDQIDSTEQNLDTSDDVETDEIEGSNELDGNHSDSEVETSEELDDDQLKSTHNKQASDNNSDIGTSKTSNIPSDLTNTLRSDRKSLPFPKSVLPWNDVESNLTKELLSAGYTTIKIIATSTVQEIQSLTTLSTHQANQLIQNAKGWEEFNFETAANLLEDRKKFQRISTGSKSLDLMLGGGIEPRSITEFYGSYTTGKTQLSIQLAVNTALSKEMGGLDGFVIYLDTEGSFRPERVVQICNAIDVDPEVILNRILVGRAHNTNIQMQLTNNMLEIGSNHPVKLVIVDSLTSNFRAEFIGKGAIMERQQKMNQHVQQLSRISDMLNVAIVITNQVMAVIDGYQNTIQPVGGNILAHGSTHRVELRKSDTHPNVRYAKLIASPSLPEATGNYKITTEGIKDVMS